jgi:transposase
MGKLALSGKEKRRLEIFQRVKRQVISLHKAAELLRLSYRQAKRSYARYGREGASGLGHRLRGRGSNRRAEAAERLAIVQRYRERYGDFGPTLAAEYLAKEKLAVPVQTLRRWLIEEGLWQVTRARAVHRRWRARKECLGEMVQMDGSHHDWFEGRRPWAVLMVMIDDATNRSYVRFFEEETTVAAMTTFQRYVSRHGLPRSLYVDRDSIYRVTRDATVDEELAGIRPLSQFGRAMRELEVEVICAHSPQAKGRVERRNGMLQDRLVKAMRLAGIASLEEANGFVEGEEWRGIEERFAVAPARKADLHRRVPAEVNLALVLSFQEERVVQADWTVSWRQRWFQLTESNQKLALVKQRVMVCEQLDGKIRLRYKGRELAWEELPERPKKVVSKAAARPKQPKTGLAKEKGFKGPWKPPADHPWRQG